MAGIYPVHEGASTRIATPNSPGAPRDPRPDLIVGLGAALERSSAQVTDAYRRRKELEDDGEVMRRYMDAVSEMEAGHEQLTVPENALKAKELFDAQITAREPSWYDGLSPAASQKLQQKLFGKTLEYRGAAAKTENRAKIEQFGATVKRAEIAFSDEASRRTTGEDPSQLPAYKDFKDLLQSGVNAGLYKPAEMIEKEDAALKHAAYNRLYRVTASNNQEEIKQVLEYFKESEAATQTKDDPTFLKHIDSRSRIELKKQLQSRLKTLDAEETRRINDERTETERRHKLEAEAVNVQASRMADEPEKYGPLTRDYIDKMESLRYFDEKQSRYWRDRVSDIGASGTPTGRSNPELLGRLIDAAYTVQTPEAAQRLQQEILAGMHDHQISSGINSDGQKLLAHVQSIAKLPADAVMTPRQETNDAQELTRIALRINHGQPIPRELQPIIQEAYEKFAADAKAGSPKGGMAIYNENVDNWQARAGIPIRNRISELRKSQGMPNADPKTMGTPADESITKMASGLEQRYDAAPPGPQGDAERAAVREAIKQLKKVETAEREFRRIKDLREQAKQQGGGGTLSTPSQSKPSGGGSIPPVPGPRR